MCSLRHRGRRRGRGRGGGWGGDGGIGTGAVDCRLPDVIGSQTREWNQLPGKQFASKDSPCRHITLTSAALVTAKSTFATLPSLATHQSS